jgi:hypothetical protein
MSTPPTDPAPSLDPVMPCSAVSGELRALGSAVGDSRSRTRLDALHAHAARCAECRSRHGAALARLAGVCALRSRALAGLSTEVLARIRSGPAAGGMSPAFLDAPHSLAVWRRVAVAASLLVAVGAGLWATGRMGWRDGPGGTRDPEVRDARESLLLRWNAPRRGGGDAAFDLEDASVTPVVFPARGQRDFWLAPARPGSRAALNDSGD